LHPRNTDQRKIKVMEKAAPTSSSQYTCNEYREEMILLSLQRKLQQTLSDEERQKVLAEIARLEKAMGL